MASMFTMRVHRMPTQVDRGHLGGTQFKAPTGTVQYQTVSNDGTLNAPEDHMRGLSHTLVQLVQVDDSKVVWVKPFTFTSKVSSVCMSAVPFLVPLLSDAVVALLRAGAVYGAPD
jgi:hypothetical protein